jgi:signal transduction histidine kinase
MFALVFFGLFLDAAFLKRKLRSNGLHKVSLAIAVSASFIAVSSANVVSVMPRHEGNGAVTGYSIVPGPLSIVVALSLLILTLLLFIHFIIVHRHVEEKSKMPLRIVQRTVLIVTVVSLATNVVAPLFSGGSYFGTLINNTALLGLIVVLAITVLRYKLLDVRLIVIRAMAYLTTLFATTLLLILPIVLLFSHFMDYKPDSSTLVTLVLASGVAMYVIQYLRGVFDRLTNKLFFRHYYDAQEVLDKLGAVLVRTTEIEELQGSTKDIVSRALKPKFFEFVLFADTSADQKRLASDIRRHAKSNIVAADELDDYPALAKVLASHDIALALELRTNKEELGYLILGYKQSGDAYSTDDIKMMGIVADEVAIALQNALRFEEIERFNETLQQKVEDATRQLRESNKKLKQLNESKDDFIGMASHQLRTPLTSVKGYISLVMDGDAGKINGKQRQLLQQAFASSQKMVYLIADLLNVSRLKTGKFMIERTQINLDKLISEEMGQLQHEAAGRGLELTYEAPKDFPILPLDETKTRQVIMNFLDNAIYYTPSGGHIRAELRDLPKSVEFRVIDDGIGVPRDDRHHLFTKFYRARNAQRARPDGTGLGLYMAKKVITTQGGAIIFSSEEGKGSTFGFIFPKDMPSGNVALPAQTRD